MSWMIDRYRMVREVARGAMGTVWVAFDTQLQRQVAIKLLHEIGLESDTLHRMFKREAQAVARLQHPHVVEIYDFGVTEKGHPYMVMELLEGETLAARFRRTRSMTPVALLPILTQVARALDAAHALGVVHRDLKPHNIFVTQSGAEVMIKVFDFGVAVMHSEIAFSETIRSSSASIAGTPPYMSPEQISGEDDVDRRTDLWALAVIAYQALTGQLPFEADKLSKLALRICTGTFAPPSSRVAELPRAMDLFFRRALAKNPDERFATAHELVRAFAATLPDTAGSRTTKILVVDDESDLADLLEACFDEQIDDGLYEFVFADNGRAGLDALRKHPDVDIVITDLRMPVMDGFTFLSELGALAPTVRTIVMSAFSDMDNIRKAMNRGAFDFITKPIDVDSLEATIDKAAAEVRKLRRALQSMEENAALRMFVNPAMLDRLLPVLHTAGGAMGETRDATVVVVRVIVHSAQTEDDDIRALLQELNRTYESIMPVFDDAQGEVLRFLGDTLVCMFCGVDHNRRALSASLAVVAHDTPLDCALGVATGAIVTGDVGAPSRHRFDHVVFGKPVDRAHKLARLADPGEVLMAELLTGAEDGALELTEAERAAWAQRVSAGGPTRGSGAHMRLRRVGPTELIDLSTDGDF